MRKGQVVTVYEDPLTEKKPEGKARLVQKLPIENDPLELWEVEFLDDHSRYSSSRWIRRPEKKEEVKAKPLTDCLQWGENRRDEGYIDVGCVLGHSECDPEKCKDYRTAEDEAEEIERNSMNWRFEDSRGRSVFDR